MHPSWKRRFRRFISFVTPPQAISKDINHRIRFDCVLEMLKYKELWFMLLLCQILVSVDRKQVKEAPAQIAFGV